MDNVSSLSSNPGSTASSRKRNIDFCEDDPGWSEPLPEHSPQHWPRLGSKEEVYNSNLQDFRCNYCNGQDHDESDCGDLHSIMESSSVYSVSDSRSLHSYQQTVSTQPRHRQQMAKQQIKTSTNSKNFSLIDLPTDAVDNTETREVPEKQIRPYKPSPARELPERAQTFHDLDQDAIRAKVVAEEAFQQPLDEHSLMDGDPVSSPAHAREMADAVFKVAVREKRKNTGRAGRKGKKQAWLELTPFLNY